MGHLPTLGIMPPNSDAFHTEHQQIKPLHMLRPSVRMIKSFICTRRIVTVVKWTVSYLCVFSHLAMCLSDAAGHTNHQKTEQSEGLHSKSGDFTFLISLQISSIRNTFCTLNLSLDDKTSLDAKTVKKRPEVCCTLGRED